MRHRLLVLPIALSLPVGASRGLAQVAAPPPVPLRVTGYLQPRETYQSGVGLTGSIHRARLIVDGVPLVGRHRTAGRHRESGSLGRHAPDHQ
ncbi:MAG TPA: hypothetical protein VEM13_00600 [Gemmatimonadales bacterium]|nr:hypothetical protein [Gemmatimonadales bacterium]